MAIGEMSFLARKKGSADELFGEGEKWAGYAA